MGLTATPRTWVTAEVVTAAMMNAEIRDAVNGLEAAWTSYTPTVSTWTLGNGTATGKYMQVGKTINFRINFTFGSTSVASGQVSFSLPVTSVALFSTPGDPIGTATFRDASVPANDSGPLILSSTTQCQPRLASLAVTGVSTPWTWAAGDLISLSGTYEAA